MKTNKVKKVLSIVILSIIVAITIATIVLAVVPKNQYDPIADNYKVITVYKDKKTQNYENVENVSEEKKSVVARIKEEHAASLQDNLLSSIFQGTSSFEKSVVYEKTSTDCKANVANIDGVVCLVFDYLNEQTLKIDGEAYTHSDAKGEGNTITYRKVFMQVSNNDDYQECVAYLADSNNKSNFKIKFLAHQGDLYDYLVNLDLGY